MVNDMLTFLYAHRAPRSNFPMDLTVNLVETDHNPLV
jgi:hypothetical protein